MDRLTRLALDARDGDQRAFDVFVETAYEQVWRFCAMFVDRESAEDLTQEAFIRIVRALPGFEGESSARTWLLAIARNTCVDELRSRKRRSRQAQAILAVVGVSHLAPDPVQEAALSDLVGRLEPDRRAAFVLTQVLGLPYEESATICACRVGTIRSRVSRARSDLVRSMRQADSEGHLIWSSSSSSA